ncbi:hypothetical protein [Mucilaginibacter pedocola]|uniref:Uncharacterized protein n=1 Tax=Mucilaginibacter pedocola TaxID=1792845 RepID=A0A1S9PBB9_9SPHI|nr:hypothetical protein [Mucilaginibacter pedocola]OOQ58250.1 hypothetical protein BC343_11450 [Mucilaginibacter pedocola]
MATANKIPLWLLVALILLTAPMLIQAKYVLPVACSMCYSCTAGVENWVLVTGMLTFFVLVYLSAKK